MMDKVETYRAFRLGDTITLKVKVPKPGDKLPFTCFVGVDGSGSYGYGRNGQFCNLDHRSQHLGCLPFLLGLPDSVSVTNIVQAAEARTTEEAV